MSELHFILEGDAEPPSLLNIKIEEKGALHKRLLYKDTLQSLASDKDLSALQFLIKEEFLRLGVPPNSSKADTIAFSRIRIPSEKMEDALKILGATGKLYWKGKKVLVDPFSTVEMTILASLQEGGLLLDGKMEALGKEFDMGLCDWIFTGRTTWILKENVLQKLKERIDKKWIQLVYPKTTLITGKEAEEFFKTFEKESPDFAPKVKWKGISSEPMPILKLKDRSGAFADLWMDYKGMQKVSFQDPKSYPFRDKEKEKFWEKDLKESGYLPKNLNDSQYYCSMDKVQESLKFLLEMGWPIFDVAGNKLLLQGDHKLLVKEQEDHIVVEGTVSFEEVEADFQNVYSAVQKKQSFLQLGNGFVGLLDPKAAKASLGDTELEVTAKGAQVRKSAFGALDTLLNHPNVRADLKCIPSKIEDCTLNGFSGTLHPYQKEGVSWLYSLYRSGFSALLADEMGLGKTVQSLAFFSSIEKKGPILVVAPTSLLFNWRKECEKFLPSVSLYVHTGKERIKDPAFLKKQEIILTSYALLRVDASLFQDLKYTCVALDEAQMIKNSESQIAKAVFLLRSDFRLAITGTPMENRWEDLWSLFFFLMPTLLGEKKDFSLKVTSSSSPTLKLIRPFILRRRKEEVAKDLPPKIEQLIWVDMTDWQKEVYEEWVRLYKGGLLKKIAQEGLTSCRMEILEAVLRLRQIACHPCLADASLDPLKSSGKLDQLFSDLEELFQEKRKVIVYSQFTKMLSLIETQAKTQGYNYVYLDGSTKDREGAVQRFQEEEDVLLFLVSLKAGGVGLNLTAADCVILLDPWWNEAVEAQAIDRAHRLGRKGSLIARRYITPFSIEENILKLKEHKSLLLSSLLEGEETTSLEDLYNLLMLS